MVLEAKKEKTPCTIRQLKETAPREIPGGSTSPAGLFTVFTGIILTADIERARKGSAAENTKG